MQLIRFARVCFNAGEFNNRNQFLTSKLLKQCCRYHKLRKVFSNIITATQSKDWFKNSSATRHIEIGIYGDLKLMESLILVINLIKDN